MLVFIAERIGRNLGTLLITLEYLFGTILELNSHPKMAWKTKTNFANLVMFGRGNRKAAAEARYYLYDNFKIYLFQFN